MSASDPFAPEDRDTSYDDSYPASSKGEKISCIGPTLVVKGELSAGEDLLIQGRVEGKIKQNERNLTIGRQGSVKANIKAKTIIVEGAVEGDMHATESVVVQATANVRGNIYSPRVGLVEGAKFKGSIDMDGFPESKSAPRSKSSANGGALGDDQVDELLSK